MPKEEKICLMTGNEQDLYGAQLERVKTHLWRMPKMELLTPALCLDAHNTVLKLVGQKPSFPSMLTDEPISGIYYKGFEYIVNAMKKGDRAALHRLTTPVSILDPTRYTLAREAEIHSKVVAGWSLGKAHKLSFQDPYVIDPDVLAASEQLDVTCRSDMGVSGKLRIVTGTYACCQRGMMGKFYQEGLATRLDPEYSLYMSPDSRRTSEEVPYDIWPNGEIFSTTSKLAGLADSLCVDGILPLFGDDRIEYVEAASALGGVAFCTKTLEEAKAARMFAWPKELVGIENKGSILYGVSAARQIRLYLDALCRPRTYYHGYTVNPDNALPELTLPTL